MRLFISIFFTLVFLCLQFFTYSESAGLQFIQETCKRSTDSDPKLSYDFCVTSLQADPQSFTADLQGLGVISVKLAIANATSTSKHINDLLKKKPSDPFTKERLQSCLDQYSDAISTLQDAKRDFESKRYGDANIHVTAAMDDATSCEDGFKEGQGHGSPLTKENDNLFQLGAIGLAITQLAK